MSIIKPPKPGDPISADWGQRMTERVNRVFAEGECYQDSTGTYVRGARRRVEVTAKQVFIPAWIHSAVPYRQRLLYPGSIYIMGVASANIWEYGWAEPSKIYRGNIPDSGLLPAEPDRMADQDRRPWKVLYKDGYLVKRGGTAYNFMEVNNTGFYARGYPVKPSFYPAEWDDDPPPGFSELLLQVGPVPVGSVVTLQEISFSYRESWWEKDHYETFTEYWFSYPNPIINLSDLLREKLDIDGGTF